MRAITPAELKARVERGDRLVLIDVRTPEEHAIARLPHAKLIPMEELHARIGELDPDSDADVVIYCHHGIRSAHVIAHLEAQGFTRLFNLRGGIDAWSREVDPSVPRY